MSLNILGIDVGEKRVGLAIARAGVRVSMPLTTLDRQDTGFWQLLTALLNENDIEEIVIGLPRGLEGQETAQTRSAQDFGVELAEHVKLPLRWQDEAVTSILAEDILRDSGKQYKKSDIDAMAASFILTDYLEMKGSIT